MSITATDAVAVAREYVRDTGIDYPTQGLVADRFEAGWVVYAPVPVDTDWVDDSVLNTRNQNGLLSFCYWRVDGRWWRGATDTFDELDDPLPVIWTPQETVEAMTAVVGREVENFCHELLSAAEGRAVSRPGVAAVCNSLTDPDIDAALNQLRLAGLTP